MGGNIIQIIIKFLHIFPVVSFGIAEAKHSFLENGIFSIPQGNGKTQLLIDVGDTTDTVFAPAVNPAPGLVMGEIIPGLPVGTVIFPDRSPLAARQIGPPFFERNIFFRVA